MKKKYTLRAIGLCLCGLTIALFAGNGFAQEIRSWQSLDGQETLRASLVEYEPKTKTAKLRTVNGDLIELKVNQLSNVDRRYLRNFRKQNRTADSPDALDNPAKPRENSRKKSSRFVRSRSANSTNLLGIEWIPEMDVALKAAAGGEGEGDDRPLMWFRVLGDLQGLM